MSITLCWVLNFRKKPLQCSSVGYFFKWRPHFLSKVHENWIFKNEKKSKFEFFSIELFPNGVFSPFFINFAQKMWLSLKKVPYRRTLQWLLWNIYSFISIKRPVLLNVLFEIQTVQISIKRTVNYIKKGSERKFFARSLLHLPYHLILWVIIA